MWNGILRDALHTLIPLYLASNWWFLSLTHTYTVSLLHQHLLILSNKGGKRCGPPNIAKLPLPSSLAIVLAGLGWWKLESNNISFWKMHQVSKFLTLAQAVLAIGQGSLVCQEHLHMCPGTNSPNTKESFKPSHPTSVPTELYHIAFFSAKQPCCIWAFH